MVLRCFHDGFEVQYANQFVDELNRAEFKSDLSI